MQAAGAALVQGAADAIQQDAAQLQQFSTGGGAAAGEQPGMQQQPQQGGGLSQLLQKQTQNTVQSALSPELGPAMAGVPQLDFNQMAAMTMPSNTNSVPNDLLALLRQRGMVL